MLQVILLCCAFYCTKWCRRKKAREDEERWKHFSLQKNDHISKFFEFASFFRIQALSASSRAAAVAEAASGGRGDMAASKDKQRLLEEEKV